MTYRNIDNNVENSNMIKLRLEIDNEIQKQTVEICDLNNNIDPTVDDFLDMFESGLVGLGYAKYEFEKKEEE
jgi:hypothetical protein